MKNNSKQNIILVIVGLISTLLMLELIVRKFNSAPSIIENVGAYRLVDNPKIVYGLTPGAKLYGEIMNKQGYRGADFVIQKSANVIRIAMLGDSVTEGMRIPSEKTFSYKLEVLLKQKASEQKSNLKYEVMNFGIGGYNLEAEAELLRTDVLKYSPDIVILNLAFNDNEPIPGMHLWFVYDNGLSDKQKLFIYNRYFLKKNIVSYFITKKILYKSKLFLLVMDRFGAINEGMSRLSGLVKKNYAADIKITGEDLIFKHLSEIEQLRKKCGFKFLVCIQSLLQENDHPNNKKYAELIKRLHFPYFYTNTYYKNLSSLVLIEKDYCHLNELGHSIVAEAMFQELKNRSWIDLQ